MTTGPEELSLNYLLDPAFQLVNTAGRPLTNGWIEVYYHGTRDKYYCASDFDGTLHPFKIPLDSLGSNIVLADPNFSYDIYVYNSFGSLQMSRYNVNPGSGSGGGSSGEGGPAEHWSSDTAGGASTTVTGGTTVYLTLPSSEDQPEFVDHTTDTAIFLKEGLYHIDAVVSFKQDEDDLQNIIKDLVVNTGLIGWDAQMTGQKNWTGPESTDDDRHFLELHTVVSVPEDSLQTLYFQISSPVDLDSAAIEKLDIVKLTAGGGGMRYAAGYGIDITGQVISTSGMMPEASAANFVDNSTYQVDIQNIYDTIAETSAMIPSGVATEQYVQDFTSAFITEDALNGYATQDWVVDQGYITSADLPQSVPLVAGEGISIVDTSASTIISVDSAYSPGVSEEWVEDYVSNATSGFITSADIPDVPEDLVTSAELATVSGDIVNQIPSLDGYATQQWVEDQHFITSADIPDVPEDVVTSGELATVSGDIVNMIPSLDGYATEQFVEDYTSAFITSADVPHFTQEQADWNEDDQSAPDYIKNKPTIPSIEGLASEQYVQDYTSAFITSADIPDVPADVVTSGQLATVSGEIVNQIPDTSDMATKTWVGQQGFLTSVPAEYATSGDLVTLSGAIEDEIPSYTAGDNISIVSDTISVSGTAGLIAGNNISITPSGESYVISSTGGSIDQIYHDDTLDGLGTIASPLTVTSADIWNEAAGMNEYPISAGPGMSIEDVSGVTVFSCTGGEVPADVVTSGQLATVSGEIMNEIPDLTGYATQTWVSDGFMETSGLEFNSQDEISGYNGHPVMTVDSEKQWLTHDDTIAHVTNSAQYAFGVNVPVVAQAMGTDETELWSSSALASSAALSEPLTNFDFLEVYTRSADNGYQAFKYTAVDGPVNLTYFKGNNYPVMIMAQITFSGSTVSVTRTLGLAYTWGSTNIPTVARANNADDKNILIKIVGIGRKENT